MSILGSHYRGSKAYFDVYREIVKAANDKTAITYKPLLELMGLRSGNYGATEVGRLLDELNEDVQKAKLPMLSAIVVNGDSNRPGPGFFDFAVTLGRLRAGASDEEREKFWESEVQRVFDAKWPSSATAFTIKRSAEDS